jgi:hypothetical protein
MNKFLLLVALLFAASAGRAQTNLLSVQSVDSQWPDTTTMGASLSFNVLIKNLDGAFQYNDTIDLLIEVDSAGILYPADTIHLGLQTINALDTATFNINHTIGSRYSPGNNVVVIWPISGSGSYGDSLIIDVFVLDPSRIKENEGEMSFIAFPNPVSRFVSVKTPWPFSKGIPYVVYGSSGKLVLEGEVYSEERIDLSGLPAGLYFLELLTDNRNARIPIIKK